jgi:hypothetical protein
LSNHKQIVFLAMPFITKWYHATCLRSKHGTAVNQGQHQSKAEIQTDLL